MSPEGPKEISSDDLFGGKKVVLFAVPGAFTPACSQRHLPGYVDKASDLKAKGVDTIACIAVNDPAVMTFKHVIHIPTAVVGYQNAGNNQSAMTGGASGQ